MFYSKMLKARIKTYDNGYLVDGVFENALWECLLSRLVWLSCRSSETRLRSFLICIADETK